MQPTLRPATAADQDFVRALLLTTSKPYVEQTWGWSDEIQQLVDQDFERWFNPPESGRIVQVDGRDVGYLKSVEQEDDQRLVREAPRAVGGVGGAEHGARSLTWRVRGRAGPVVPGAGRQARRSFGGGSISRSHLSSPLDVFPLSCSTRASIRRRSCRSRRRRF